VSPFRLVRRQWLLLLGLLMVSRPSDAGPDDIHILLVGDSPTQRAFSQALKARYPSALIRSDLTEQTGRRPAAVTILVGASALKLALEQGWKGPSISVLVSGQAYRQLTSHASHEHPNLTALLADPPISAQVQLMAALFERGVSIGVLLSDASMYLERPLKQAALAQGLELSIERVDAAAGVFRALNDLSAAQVLLAVPDSTIYNPDTLRAILESTYRRGVPVVGFSPATVTAGTLASAYSDVDDLVADLSEVIDSGGWSANGSLREPRYCKYWRVQINDSVARSLGLVLSDKVPKLGAHPPGRTP
jgi:putative tryptophan/tyrosine transport system substrate-binding protein